MELKDKQKEIKNKWFDENCKLSLLLSNSIIPLRPDIGFFIKVNNVEIPSVYFAEEFEIITKNYFKVLEKLQNYHKIKNTKI